MYLKTRKKKTYDLNFRIIHNKTIIRLKFLNEYMIATDQILDCTGLTCPMPILKLAKAVKKMDSSKVIQMIGTDPGSQKDVPDWVERNKHELIHHEIVDGKFHYYVKKK